MRALRLCYIGPAESVTFRRWVEWFAARGHQATVLTVEPAPADQVAGFRQIDLGNGGGPRKLARLVAAARMAGAVSRLRPDVVHVHYLRGLAWGLTLTRAHPAVMTPWGSDILAEQGAFREWYSRGLTSAVLRRADLVTAHSAYVETRVREVEPRIARLCRIGWGVDLRLFRPGLTVDALRQRWGIEEQQRVIFSPRLARPFYNHEAVLRALPAVRGRIRNALVVIPAHRADPGYVERLRRLAVELGVEAQVRFVDSIPYQEMPLWMNLAEVVIMLPRSDGMPNSLLEAMACGAVPVLSRLPQYAEVIRHGENGFLVGPEGPEIVEALVQALGSPGFTQEAARVNRALVADLADQDREMARMQDEYRQLACA